MPRKERDEKRRDNKGRLLKSGESQRSDGRYAYKYIDTFWCPLTGVTLQVSEPPADIASAVSAGDFFLSHAPLAVD